MMEAEGETRGARTHAALIARGKALAATEPNYARFLLYAIRATDPDDLALHSAAVIDAELRRAYALLEKRGQANHFIQLSTADVLVLDAPEIIDIFSPDMPFIVDSVLAAIRAKGGKVRLMSHPVLPLDPQSYRVLNEPTPQSRQESFLHLHLDPLPDEATRSAMLAEIGEVLDQVALVVRGWRPMLERLRQFVQDVRENPPPVDPNRLNETIQFLGWLAAHNFTFLGLREYAVKLGDGEAHLEPVAGSGVGLLEDPGFLFLRQGQRLVESTPEHMAFLSSPDLVMVSKANVRSRVHRRSHMDYVGIKLFDARGAASGEIRIVGLFTSGATGTPNAEIPLLRGKLAAVLADSGTVPDSHAGRALLQALESYPRDELFQIGPEELLEYATAVASLPDRPRVRVLPRIDRFDNFVSILLFMPRDRYDSEVRARIGDYLAERYEGRVSAYYPYFPEGELVRVHFVIGRHGGSTPRPDREDLERDVEALTRHFGDRLVAAAPDPLAIEPYRNAFPPGYQAVTNPAQALGDIAIFRNLGDDVAIHLAPAPNAGGTLALKLYHRLAPLPLSDRVPLLENFGFRVINEETHHIRPVGEPEGFLHDMVLALPAGVGLPDGVAIARVEEALLATWHGQAENDAFNQLTVGAGLAWRDAALLRALGRYLRQLGLAFSQRYLARTLAVHADAAAALVHLFHALHAPDFSGGREPVEAAARLAIATALERTAALDEDRIIRRMLNLVDAVVRTNFYQRDALGGHRPALGLKFDCRLVAEMPEPRPFREIFVYAPQVEGLHLRLGPVARGGIRWSDRPEDFRTEVLGLLKSQHVKNAIIVPVGAKGAFVPKLLPAGGDREAVQREAISCYRIFVSTLLDLTDNIVGGLIVPPPGIVRHDGDDPYLVVAADKGTGSFSDIANRLAIERGFWLGDAFASGGSSGYDHKGLGITARGAWEAVKRHFRALGRDIQRTPFTVAGVGDMSGDVFGNAMLLSPQTRLVAAFDHRDIFIDPDPDPAMTFAERRRLFELPGSSWQDYNRTILSPGGGVFSRSLKRLDLSPEARRLLGLVNGELTPHEVISAILRAEVDLLWFGGIGTYGRGAGETDAQVGDRSNDAVRITGGAIRAKVVGEGANLGMTQRGRVDYALKGGRIDTDSIDNSAGVNCSDLEVNIKIALDAVVAAHRMTPEQRSDLLAAASGEVVELSIRNNYLQTLALSLAEREEQAGFADQRRLLEQLERRDELNRTLEYLPDDETLDRRAATGGSFTRPELAILLSYAKLSLRADLLATDVSDDPYLGRELFAYFPPRVADDQREAIDTHRLRREIVATTLANAMINRGGPAFAVGLMEATGADAAAVARAYAAARDAFGLSELNRQIDALDGKVPDATQLALYAEVQALLRQQTPWFLRNESFADGLSELVARYALGIADIRDSLDAIMPSALADDLAARAAGFAADGVPDELARRIAALPALGLVGNAVLVATRSGVEAPDAARAFFAVIDLFGLIRAVEAATTFRPADCFDRLALDRALANLARAERDLAADVLASGTGPVEARLAAWREAHQAAIDRAIRAVGELTAGPPSVSRLSVAAGLMSDLARGR
ncbi:MAG: NAD-glutamate dehydrogenase [Devosia sp.]|nr:NAD-glutamate dehydrogenase [Devosia sp.]